MRLDAFLKAAGYFPSREKAAEAIRRGAVTVGGRPAAKPSEKVGAGEDILVSDERAYVGRGAIKLLRAFEVFDLDVAGKACLDAGASTGGFTQVLLEKGAALVWAVDVGTGQLDGALLKDKRVVSMENTDIRALSPEKLRPAPKFCTADLSFISLSHVLSPLYALTAPEAEAVVLIKPQFEAGREAVAKRGLVRDWKTHERVLEAFVSHANSAGFFVSGLAPSPVRGGGGNAEYLSHLKKRGANAPLDIKGAVNAAAGQDTG